MEIEWEHVKIKTLWHYEKLIAKILDVLGFNFVQEYYAHDMTAYYESIGKSFADFKTVIPLDWMIGGVKVLPIIIEDE